MESAKIIRPFSQSANVKNRDRSRRLELALLDFGADHSFKKAVEKIYRHYGVKVAENTTRLDVYKHAKIMQETNYALSGEQSVEAETIIGEIDGGHIPTVRKKDPLFIGDQRKNRIHEWREARLTLAYVKGTIYPLYSAKIGLPNEIGDMFEQTINRAGRGEKTKIHCVGDGALWIAEQVKEKFGDDAYYMLDFYHASEYIAAAAKCCSTDSPEQWRRTQQENLMIGNVKILFDELSLHAAACTLSENCPGLKCYNYLVKREKQLDYKTAIASDLPIGSGKIESGIRSVVHERLKKSGSWWNIDNAQSMLHLRAVVANRRLDAYGQDLRHSTFRAFS